MQYGMFTCAQKLTGGQLNLAHVGLGEKRSNFYKAVYIHTYIQIYIAPKS